MTQRTPTAEQQAAIDIYATGQDLVIEAGAGTGKTTTLELLARSQPDRDAVYLAFNKAIAQEAAAKMPMNVEARTVHSFAMRAIRHQYPGGDVLLDRLRGSSRLKPWHLAKHLGVPKGYRVEIGERSKVLQPTWLAGHVMRAANLFCQSGDPEPTWRHFPYVPSLDVPLPSGRPGRANNRSLAMALEPCLRKAWADLTDPYGQLRFGHGVYLKLWQLGGYQLPGDVLFFDEAQDASGVMLAAVANQGHQVVYVGDSAQQIYAWNGAVNAMGQLDEDVPRAYLTQSWRFGQAVANVANVILEHLETPLRLTGSPHLDTLVHTSRATAPAPTAILTRSNARAVEEVLAAQEAGLRPHLVGGADELVAFAVAAGKLQSGERTTHPELACFDDWREVLAYVDEDPQGSELAVLVKMIEDYGVQIVCDALDGLVGENGADVIVSTAHKAKGREWPAVQLGPDFDGKGDAGDELDDPEEARLLYVACTRAVEHLDVSACRTVRRAIGA
jgi:hypothetical protein